MFLPQVCTDHSSVTSPTMGEVVVLNVSSCCPPYFQFPINCCVARSQSFVANNRHPDSILHSQQISLPNPTCCSPSPSHSRDFSNRTWSSHYPPHVPSNRRNKSSPANVPPLVIRKAFNGSVRFRKAGYLNVAPYTPANPTARPAIPPPMPPLSVALYPSALSSGGIYRDSSSAHT